MNDPYFPPVFPLVTATDLFGLTTADVCRQLICALQLAHSVRQILQAFQERQPARIGMKGIERRIYRRRRQDCEAEIASALQLHETMIQLTQSAVDRSGQIRSVRYQSGIQLA